MNSLLYIFKKNIIIFRNGEIEYEWKVAIEENLRKYSIAISKY